MKLTSSFWSPSRAYTPEAHGVGIVHIGAGAFHRAHQADHTDDVLAQSGGDWRILGVSLRSVALADKLNAQGGRYHLVIRADNDQPPEMRVIGSIAGVLAAKNGLDPILQAMTAETTRIVSLTITEKAYGYDRAKGALDLNDPLIAADLATPEAPQSAIGLIVRALQIRKEAGQKAFTVLSCDNLPNNGQLLRAAVLDFAQRVDPALAVWITENARFPATMVDRITPACTEALIAETEVATGLKDLAPIETESFSQWVIEDDFCNGRPAWDTAGALFVKDVTPFENMKLRMLNGAHSLLAYSGYLSGKPYVRDVMADDVLAAVVDRHIKAAAATLGAIEGIDLDDYRQALLQRFTNPNIAHETFQIAMDGSQKLPQRIFEPALVALAQGSDADTFAFATAAWIRFLSGQGDQGDSYTVQDPRAAEFAAVCAEHGASAKALTEAIFALPNLLPTDLAENTAFGSAVQAHLARMMQAGMAAAIKDLAGGGHA